jgi:hypothetical protein
MTGTALFLFALLAACGGSQEESTLPDESADLLVGERGSGFSAEGTSPAGPDLGGTRWQWVEAHCTEGPLDLRVRGFAQFLRVDADNEGLLLTYDQVFATEECAQTLVQRARPTQNPRMWAMIEQARVAQPSTDECFGRMEEERPGEVRRRGEFVEVLVQRSMVWCNGLEVRHVYAPAPPEPLTNDQIVRHYVAHFNRRDPKRVAQLFAASGSLVEPFHVTHTGGPTRHDGREQIEQWYREVLGSPVDWLAMKLEAVSPSRQGMTAGWLYMDPRLSEPMGGRTHFTIAAGEIFEARVELTSEPALGGGEGEGAAEGSGGEGESATDG